jgi:hypothetical protein
VFESLPITPQAGELKLIGASAKFWYLRCGPIVSIRPMYVQLMLLAFTITPIELVPLVTKSSSGAVDTAASQPDS